MPLSIVNLGMFRNATKELSDDTALVIQLDEEEYYEQNCNGITYYPSTLDAPPVIVFEAGQEITKDQYMLEREDAYLENNVGQFLKYE